MRTVRYLTGPRAERIQSLRDARATDLQTLSLAWEQEQREAVAAELEAAADHLLAIAAAWPAGRTCHDWHR